MDTIKLGTGSRDAISWLPQEVLCDILSLLPTKLAASTTVLSKKWRNVFALVISRCVELEDGLLLPVFNNLVTLSFGSKNKRGWKLLPRLLNQSPKLETLIIQGLDGYTGDATISLFKVKVLRVLGYRGTAQELQHLKSFLVGSECIELVRVEIPECVEVDDGIVSQVHEDLMALVLPNCLTQVHYFI
ncbi:unnamed protein product [Thlaspi arvense]|uniref:F-box domain-containing protein n=1 Tax=Thlaspi arvense TaxID=13288 RepID=A0AAU9SH15_THLAR|nr:unnamed protein product [Thlaspi arvense]